MVFDDDLDETKAFPESLESLDEICGAVYNSMQSTKPGMVKECGLGALYLNLKTAPCKDVRLYMPASANSGEQGARTSSLSGVSRT